MTVVTAPAIVSPVTATAGLTPPTVSAPAAPSQDSAASDRVLLVAIAALLAFTCFGHFAKPHGDFLEFFETGDALLGGEPPATLKRAPLFPLLLAGLARLLEWHGRLPRPAPALAGELINTLLLPLNVLLTHALACAWISPGAGRWAALLFALLPVGLYCTAHSLVEPLMLTSMLATVLLAARGSSLAYVAAALACVARYDLAGLLVGLVWWDRQRGTRPPALLRRALPAAAPLVLWLAATAVTWAERSRDHYLAQIAEAHAIDLLGTLRLFGRGFWDPSRLRLPVWCGEYESWLAASARVGLVLLAALGGVRLLLARAPGFSVALIALVGYAFVHAALPFDFVRFAYPLLPVLAIAVVHGAEHAARGLHLLPGRRLALAVVSVLLSAVALVVVSGEAGGLADLLRARPDWPVSVVWIALGATLAMVATAPRGRTPRTLLLVLLLPVALVQARVGIQTLGSGREMQPLMDALRWVDQQRADGECVFSPTPGLARLYRPHRAALCDLGPEDLHSANWDDLQEELRERRARWLVWYDVFTEQGDYYVAKWGLDRFAPLEEPETARGVELLRTFDDGPMPVRVFRLAPDATSP